MVSLAALTAAMPAHLIELLWPMYELPAAGLLAVGFLHAGIAV